VKESNCRSSLGVPYLEEFWARLTRRSTDSPANKWRADRVLIDGLGLGLEETLQYLDRQQPTLAEFERWILERNDQGIEPQRIERINATLNGSARQGYSTDSSSTSRRLSKIRFVLLAASMVTGKDCADFSKSKVPPVISTI
jgi:hypothetical protein